MKKLDKLIFQKNKNSNMSEYNEYSVGLLSSVDGKPEIAGKVKLDHDIFTNFTINKHILHANEKGLLIGSDIYSWDVIEDIMRKMKS